ncbi:Fibronectin type III domain-containing protein [Pedococcus cremeus]|uniref:Fibronectin type III domain-containing protein n=1 Tax=Pedococcus cremeus TaxID=587636 RepID=A0A1H9WFL1_9MICO|nr:FG-GAP-like repeat-containing protein [Pedococcus cremeus]SES32571.1 Fibronectin type III domain-containing protein [Pedococcus cremeus]
MAPARVRRLVLAVVAALVATMGTASVAVAVTDPPVLTALSVSTTSVTSPGSVELRYSVAADTPTLGYISAWYASPAGVRGNVVMRVDDAPLGGTLTWSVPDGARNGTYQLMSVTVMSTDGTAAIRYDRDGTTSRGALHTFDLPGKDVTVSGEEDVTGPTLTGVSVTTPDVKPGQPVTVAWTADDAHPVVEASFTFTGATKPSSFTMSSTTTSELAAVRFTRPLSSAVYNDRHLLSMVRLRDVLGNTTTWYADGRMTNLPYDATTESGTHTIGFSSVGFSVTGSTYDDRSPVLTAISVDRRTSRASGRVTVSYAFNEDTLPLSQIVLRYVRRGTDIPAFSLCATKVPATGSFTDTLPADVVGDVQLASVELMDSKGNQATYQRDGTLLRRPYESTGRHTLDLSTLDVRVTPSALSAVARSRPRAAGLRWSVPAGQGSQLTGFRVTVNPGGRVLTVASNGRDYQETVVTGLTNARKYTFTITPQSSVGPGPTSTVSATPLLSGNIWAAGDVNGDRRNDVFAMVQPPADAVVRLYRGTGKPGLGTANNVADWTGYRPHPAEGNDIYSSHLVLAAWGDLEMAAVDRSGHGIGSGLVGTGWGGMRFIDASADFTGDKVADIVAVNPSGGLYLYRGRGNAKFASATRVGSGWDTMQTVFAATDVTGDRRADLLAVDAAGRLRIYPGNGRGGFGASRVVGPGWGAFGAVFSGRDLTGDGRADLGAVTMSGDLYVYKGNGRGGFPTHTKIGHGWHNFF